MEITLNIHKSDLEALKWALKCWDAMSQSDCKDKYLADCTDHMHNEYEAALSVVDKIEKAQGETEELAPVASLDPELEKMRQEDIKFFNDLTWYK